MTDQQAQDIIAALGQLHTDNQAVLTLAAAQAGYTMHLHQMVCWLVYLVVIFGLCLIAMARPRGPV